MNKIVIIKTEAQVVEVFEDGMLLSDSEKWLEFPFEPDFDNIDSIVAACEEEWPGAAIEVR